MLNINIRMIALIISALFAQAVSGQVQDSLFARLKPLTKEKDPIKVENGIRELVKDLQLDPDRDAESMDMLYGTSALAHINIGDTLAFDKQIEKMRNKFNQTSYMNMAVDQLLKNKFQPDYVERLSKRTIDLYNSYRFDSSARPLDFQKEDWARFMKMAEIPYYQSHSRALYQNKKERVALLYFEMAMEDTGVPVSDLPTIKFYAELLLSNCKNDRAYRLLLNTAQTGRSTNWMNDRLKELHKKKTGSDQSMSQLLDSIQQNLSLSYLAEARANMIRGELAPAFELFDVNGKKVSLTDYRNRVVVLDFWATWCAPCIASMPAMDSVRRNHPDVVFLFISTGESGKDWKSKVAIAAQKNLPHATVLLSNSDDPLKNGLTSKDYKIDLIPAKVVIDKKGIIRFRGSGFESDAELIRELEAMIAVADEQ